MKNMGRRSVYPLNPQTIGERFLKFRIDKGITMLKAAQDIGISDSYLCCIERNLKIPSLKLAERIAEYFHMDIQLIHSFFIDELAKESKYQFMTNRLKEEA